MRGINNFFHKNENVLYIENSSNEFRRHRRRKRASLILPAPQGTEGSPSGAARPQAGSPRSLTIFHLR